MELNHNVAHVRERPAFGVCGASVDRLLRVAVTREAAAAELIVAAQCTPAENRAHWANTPHSISKQIAEIELRIIMCADFVCGLQKEYQWTVSRLPERKCQRTVCRLEKENFSVLCALLRKSTVCRLQREFLYVQCAMCKNCARK